MEPRHIWTPLHYALSKAIAGHRDDAAGSLALRIGDVLAAENVIESAETDFFTLFPDTVDCINEHRRAIETHGTCPSLEHSIFLVLLNKGLVARKPYRP